MNAFLEWGLHCVSQPLRLFGKANTLFWWSFTPFIATILLYFMDIFTSSSSYAYAKLICFLQWFHSIKYPLQKVQAAAFLLPNKITTFFLKTYPFSWNSYSYLKHFLLFLIVFMGTPIILTPIHCFSGQIRLFPYIGTLSLLSTYIFDIWSITLPKSKHTTG